MGPAVDPGMTGNYQPVAGGVNLFAAKRCQILMTFDYAAYYRRPQDLKRLQIPAESIRWVERYERPAESRRIVLYLGCNILRTPDIAADVVAVFTALGLDFVAVAGVQFCCGVTWDRHEDVAHGQTVSSTTVERLASFHPELVVHWCPSCDVHFNDVITGRDSHELPFRVTSAAAFLADLAEAGRMPWQHPVRARAVLHGHVGHEGHHHGRRRAREDTEQIATILRSLPDFQYLGVVDSPEELDYDCGPSSSAIERPRWRAIRAGLWTALRATGADLVVTKSHACQREWCDLAEPDIGVRCYISLVADALGCRRDYRDNLMKELKQTGDTDALVKLTRANWSSHGLAESEAREVAARYDWADRAGELPTP